MPAADLPSAPRFYFALPRLCASLRGGGTGRSENHWLEANVAGGAVYLISCLFAARLIFPEAASWQLISLLVPLAFGMLFVWMIMLYLNSLLVKLLRACGFFETLPNARAQSVLIGLLTTAFAFGLILNGSWMRLIGVAWVAGLGLNLAAAIVLGLKNGARPSAK